MKEITICTHNSTFHADDVFAVATILLVLEKEGKSADIVRTRDTEVISKADFVVDVGEEYNPEKNRFDHHQIGGGGKRENGIPFASFGLVWKKYGEGLCGSKEVFEKVDQKLVEPIDAIDSGVEIINPIFENVYPYNIGDVVDILNPSWKEDKNSTDNIFLQAVFYAKFIISREIKKTCDKFEARDIVLDAYKKAGDKRVIVLDGHYPANDFLNKFPEPLFIISPKEDGTWILNTIRDNSKSFVDRKSLPKSWGGKRDKDFEKVTGVNDLVFCQRGLFLAIAKTKEAILKLAELALKE